MAVTINASTSAGLVQTADLSGNLSLQANGTTVATASSSGLAISTYNPSASLITSGTSVATTSGTSVVIATGLPTWVKRISVILNGVGTNGTVGYLVQLGPSGSYTSTGYSGGGTRIGAGSGNPASSTAGFLINSGAIGGAKNMILTIDLVNTSFGYICSGTGYSASENNFYGTGGSVTLSAALAQVQITTTNGTDAFNAGSINILYE